MGDTTDSYNLYTDIRPMSARLFRRFSSFIQTELGIKMPEVKRTMLQARLQKRMRKLGIGSFEAYADYLFSARGMAQELPDMIDAVTTNKTDFFREPQHFDYLTEGVLPDLIRSYGTGIRKQALIWSAGCSSGEEVYTLAMVLSEFQHRYSQFRYAVLGTDISVTMLRKAILGIYNHEKAEPIPLHLRKKYLLKSKDPKKDLVRVIPALRDAVRFHRLNFMQNEFGMREMADVIFCRNVLIYFDRETQEKVLNRICRHLIAGGYLFTGHSETLSGLKVPLAQATSTVYRKIV